MHTNHFFTLANNTLAAQQNPLRATQKQAYMKSVMPFYGLTKPELDRLFLQLYKQFAPNNNGEYRATIEYFFTHAQQRELWYVALLYARKFKEYITPENIDLFITIVRIGQWWDIIDPVAVDLVGTALKSSTQLHRYANEWITDDNMWVRRTALLTQLKYKKDTDVALQTKLIIAVAHEKEFFIRKAIGWSLRELSKTQPEAVRTVLATHGNTFSGLSVREASKYL